MAACLKPPCSEACRSEREEQPQRRIEPRNIAKPNRSVTVGISLVGNEHEAPHCRGSFLRFSVPEFIQQNVDVPHALEAEPFQDRTRHRARLSEEGRRPAGDRFVPAGAEDGPLETPQAPEALPPPRYWSR